MFLDVAVAHRCVKVVLEPLNLFDRLIHLVKLVIKHPI